MINDDVLLVVDEVDPPRCKFLGQEGQAFDVLHTELWSAHEFASGEYGSSGSGSGTGIGIGLTIGIVVAPFYFANTAVN